MVAVGLLLAGCSSVAKAPTVSSNAMWLCAAVGIYAGQGPGSAAYAIEKSAMDDQLFRYAEAVDAETPGQITLQTEAEAVTAASPDDLYPRLAVLQGWCVAHGQKMFSGEGGSPPAPVAPRTP